MLRIATWTHFVPAYDTWFDEEYTTRWGDEHDITVVVDHITLTELRGPRRRGTVRRSSATTSSSTSSARRPWRTMSSIIREIVEEALLRLGPVAPLLRAQCPQPEDRPLVRLPRTPGSPARSTSAPTCGRLTGRVS